MLDVLTPSETRSSLRLQANPPTVNVYRVDVQNGDGFSMPCIRLANRRAAGSPVLGWVCQRHLEILLYNRVDGGSTGAIWKALSATGMGSTALLCNKQAVTDGVVPVAVARCASACHQRQLQALRLPAEPTVTRPAPSGITAHSCRST